MGFMEGHFHIHEIGASNLMVSQSLIGSTFIPFLVMMNLTTDDILDLPKSP